MKKRMYFLLVSFMVFIGTCNAAKSIAQNLVIEERELPSRENAKKIRVGILSANWNTDIVEPLFDACFDELMALGITIDNTTGWTVPGALELSFGAHQLIAAKSCDVIICLGAIIEGTHALWTESVAHAVVQNLSALSFMSGVPIICGVLICPSKEDAQELVEGGIGAAWARSALMMVH